VADPLAGLDEAGEFLPVAVGPDGTRDVVRPQSSWDEIPHGGAELANGSGERFVVDLSARGGRVVRVFASHLGAFQAFVER